MKPASFDYYAPRELSEAVGLLSQLGDDAKVLSGGQSLIPILAMRLTAFQALVDIGRIGVLRHVRPDGDGGVVIGAAVRHCEAEASAEIATAAPLLARATPLIGHFQIRSRGTVGGSIAHADPAAEYPAVALAMDAEMELAGPAGSRIVPAAEFFTGIWTTSVLPDEVLTAIRFPSWGAGAGFAVEEVARRHGDFALAGACVGVRVRRGTVDRAAISLFGVGPTPVRARRAEQVLLGAAPDELDPDGVGWLAVADVDPPEDLQASSALRRRIAAAVTVRALRAAIKEAASQ